MEVSRVSTKRFEGKVAVVTGGASGIGHGTVRRFVEEGAKVLIGDQNIDAANAVANSLGDTVFAKKVDVRIESEVSSLIKSAVEKWGRLDCVFNNAGFGGALGPIDETTEDDFNVTMDVLFKGVFFGSKHAARIMKSQGFGSIVNTGSVAGIRAGIGPHIYGAAKAAVIFLTQSIALELAETKVRANAVCPGYIATALATGRGESNTDRHLMKFREVCKDMQPLGRTGEPEDIGNAVLWLSSDDASFVTGQAIVIDGGLITGTAWRDQSAAFTKANPIRVYRPDDV